MKNELNEFEKQHRIKYETYPNGNKQVISVEGFSIQDDKHAYQCVLCGALFQSKNILCRSLFSSDDPRCKTCYHSIENLERVCRCEPIIRY